MAVVDTADGWRPPRREVETCIVGAGPAGITMALRLHALGRECLVLEGGGRSASLRSQRLYRGSSIGIPYSLDATRLRYFGGTTNHWAGICRPLDPYDLRTRPFVALPGWPIGHGELAAHYPVAQVLCELQGGWDVEPWFETVGAHELPADRASLRTAIFQVSPPTRFAQRYGDALASSEHVTVALNANVVSLEGDGRTIRRLRIVSNQGDEHEVRAGRVVLALGGIENARFLLNAADALADHESRRWIGACFQEHLLLPHRAAFVTSTKDLDDLAGYIGTPRLGELPFLALLSTAPEARRQERLLGFGATCSRSFPGSGVIEEIRGVPREQVDGVRSMLRFSGHAADRLLSFETWAEQEPNERSRVLLTDRRDRFGLRRAALRWELTPLDRSSISRSEALLVEELTRLGIGRAYRPDDGRVLDRRLIPACHHMGTTRMSDSPAWGAVDPDCRLHGTTNVYVAGSSVFPTSGYANPTLTVVALADRLATHLADVA